MWVASVCVCALCPRMPPVSSHMCACCSNPPAAAPPSPPQDEGMPIHGRPFERGFLYIHFTGAHPAGLLAASLPASGLPTVPDATAVSSTP